jgi:hypothetical protein
MNHRPPSRRELQEEDWIYFGAFRVAAVKKGVETEIINGGV